MTSIANLVCFCFCSRHCLLRMWWMWMWTKGVRSGRGRQAGRQTRRGRKHRSRSRTTAEKGGRRREHLRPVRSFDPATHTLLTNELNEPYPCLYILAHSLSLVLRPFSFHFLPRFLSLSRRSLLFPLRFLISPQESTFLQLQIHSLSLSLALD